MDDFYKEYILDHYRNPRNFGLLEAPDAAAEDLNPLCGDKICFQLRLDDQDRVAEVRFSGKGCAISQASASMLSETLHGETLEEVARIPEERVLENVGIGISPARMKCAMLGLKVLKKAAVRLLSDRAEAAASGSS
jgi:nitrogen fixation protein NifU and related proteins